MILYKNNIYTYYILFSFIIAIGLLVAIFFTNSMLYSASLISLIDLILLSYFFRFKLFQNNIIIIFFLYQALILNLPILYMLLTYNEVSVDYYYMKKLVDSNDVFVGNIIILIFHILVGFFIVLFKVFIFKKDFNSNFLKKTIFNGDKFFIIIVILSISYFMKIYLINTGIWFMFIDVDLKKFPLANFAIILEKLDLLVLFYFAFLHRMGKLDKKYIFLLILILIASLGFAIVSTSKEKILILIIPIIIMLFNYKRKYISFIVLTVLLYMMSGFFDYMKFLRYTTSDLQTATSEFFFSENKQLVKSQSILDDTLFFRLDYQTVLARVVKNYELFPDIYKFDYTDNIIGLVPRVIWPGKPDIGLDMNQVGRELGLLHKFDNITSLGITHVGVAYYQMGMIGIVFISIFTAMLLVLTTRIFNNHYWPGYLLGFILAITLARNGTYTNIIPTLIKTALIFYLASIFLADRNTSKKEIK